MKSVDIKVWHDPKNRLWNDERIQHSIIPDAVLIPIDDVAFLVVNYINSRVGEHYDYFIEMRL